MCRSMCCLEFENSWKIYSADTSLKFVVNKGTTFYHKTKLMNSKQSEKIKHSVDGIPGNICRVQLISLLMSFPENDLCTRKYFQEPRQKLFSHFL